MTLRDRLRPRTPTVVEATTPHPPRELIVKRDRLLERFTALQLDLGGAYYEMAIRDHLRHEVLLAKAAELQNIEAQLKAVQAQMATGFTGTISCPNCGVSSAADATFCWQCGTPRQAGAAATP